MEGTPQIVVESTDPGEGELPNGDTTVVHGCAVKFADPRVMAIIAVGHAQ